MQSDTLAPPPADSGDLRLTQAFAAALKSGALPGELDGLDDAALTAAAEFVLEVAEVRVAGTPSLRLESLGGDSLRRRMRLAIVNDDMPFLVDSIAGALAGAGIGIHRLLHPVVAVRRDGNGRLTALLPSDSSGERHESVIYIEADRVDARERRAIESELDRILADVRAAVSDYPRLKAGLGEAAARLPDGEGAALMRWFQDNHLTMLGRHVEQRDGKPTEGLGILQAPGEALWPAATRDAACRWFEDGGEAPLLIKSDRIATVHRRAALDIIVVPVRAEGKVAALEMHVGLWTSAALRAPSTRVPVLRTRLAAIEERYGFDPTAHAGKALHHVLSALPHDLLAMLSGSALEEVALTAMSLVDRPRSKFIVVPGPLGRHLFAFVWLPREAVTTARREAIREMLEQASGATVSGWALDLGDGDLALLRFVLDAAPGCSMPDVTALDDVLERMLRGWAPAVEAALSHSQNATRAARLAIDWAESFPATYRTHGDPEEAARDIVRLCALDGDEDRAVRLYRADEDGPLRLRVKIYRLGALIPLSAAVPVFENFGFSVLEEIPTALSDGRGYVHEFLLEVGEGTDIAALTARAVAIEQAIAGALKGTAENDAFNALIIRVGLDERGALLFRAWFRYLRQTGFVYGLQTVADALGRAPDVTASLIALFDARLGGNGDEGDALASVDAALAAVASIEDDRILRRLRGLVLAILRTNLFTPAAGEALAFKLDSAEVPGLPKPLPWREIWVYSPRVEGIHLRGGPIARGGLRWSDRRDDFRTEILGLMKAQVVKNAVIVPTGAKGGFYPKQLPSPVTNRDAWLAEGTESYRIFIRALLSVTDNVVEGAVVHPQGVAIRDGNDAYFVVAADKGTATFSDVANAIAVERGFWLGDAFASGGSQGYDHKAMAITARGAWVSVQRHFAEMGVDVQSDPVTVVGCGDMSGDVFGNGMLLSKSLHLVAAFDHRHIFLDPNPDAAKSWKERARLFALPRSSWADYDAGLISAGGGVFPRTQKVIPLSPEIRAVLGIATETIDPSGLITAILTAPVDLLWFGGIGTYVKAAAESNLDAGDAANDVHRVNGEQLRVRVIGEGANLGVTQAGRIAFAEGGGRINTDFIDNSAGVDCSDNEVNIKIALNREMNEGRLPFEARNELLVSMTDDVAALVLEDNRLQTLGLSLAERGGAEALPGQVRVVGILEASGRVDRAVDGIEPDEALLRRGREGRGLTRPELAILLSHGKLALQAAIETGDVATDPLLDPLLHAAFPRAMQEGYAAAIETHRLRGEIIATKMANRVVNRMGLVAPFELAEEEGASLAQVAAGYFAIDSLFDLEPLFRAIEAAPMTETGRLALLSTAGAGARLHLAGLIRALPGDHAPSQIADELAAGVGRLRDGLDLLLLAEARAQSAAMHAALTATGADPALIDQVIRLHELDGAIGSAALAHRLGAEELAVTEAYVRLGEALGLDWAKAAAARFSTVDPWERLLSSGLVRDFEQLRLEFIARHGGTDPLGEVDRWIAAQDQRVAQFRRMLDRARLAPQVSAAMLAQVAAQARVLLGR